MISICRTLYDIPEELWNESFYLPCLMIEKDQRGSMEGEVQSYEFVNIPKDLGDVSAMEAWVEGYKAGLKK